MDRHNEGEREEGGIKSKRKWVGFVELSRILRILIKI